MIVSHHLSERQKKLIRSLSLPKFRKQEGLFVAEGEKILREMLPAFRCRLLVGDQALITPLLEGSVRPIDEVVFLPGAFHFPAISALQNPRPVLALLELPEPTPAPGLPTTPIVCLDGVQDPGNVGSILRTCSWFGIREVWCSLQTADPYAPRAVQAGMGALAYLRVRRTESLAREIAPLRAAGIPVLGTFLQGQNLYHTEPLPPGKPFLLVMGNEGKGISPEVARLTTRQITIPALSTPPETPSIGSDGPFTMQPGQCESLNVAAAAAVLLSKLSDPSL